MPMTNPFTTMITSLRGYFALGEKETKNIMKKIKLQLTDSKI